MTIKTIEASGSNESMQPIGLKKWRGLRLVAEITEFEDERLCTIELQNKLESLLNATNQSAYPFGANAETISVTIEPIPVPVYDPKAIDDLEISIDNSTTLEDLAKHKESAAKLGLVQHYMDKLKSLT